MTPRRQEAKGERMSKSRLGRRVGRIALVLVLVLLVLVVGLVLFIGPVIKTAAERLGPRVLGVPVTVEKVHVNVFAGTFKLKNLRVGNPPGYSSDPLFALGELIIAVDMGSLAGTNAIVVHEVTLNDLHVSYEVVKSVANVQAIKAKVTPEETAKTAPKAAQAETGPTKPARKVIIEKLASHGGTISVRTGMTQGRAVVVPLPPIVANDIGRRTGGVTVAEVVGNIFLEITKSVGGIVVETLKNIVPDAETFSKAAGAAGNTAKGAVKVINDTLKKMF